MGEHDNHWHSVNVQGDAYRLLRQIAELEERSMGTVLRRALFTYLHLRAEASLSHDDPSRLEPEDLAALTRGST